MLFGDFFFLSPLLQFYYVSLCVFSRHTHSLGGSCVNNYDDNSRNGKTFLLLKSFDQPQREREKKSYIFCALNVFEKLAYIHAPFDVNK